MAGEASTAVVQGMTIACPPDWHDKSMLVLSAERPDASGITATLVVTREAMPGDLPPEPVACLEAFVDRQLDQMRLALDGLAVLSRRPATLAGLSAELTIDWISGGVPITQWITYAHAGAGDAAPAGPDGLVIATATTGRGNFAAAEPGFRAMLRSFRTR